jgi:hypothetical protein
MFLCGCEDVTVLKSHSPDQRFPLKENQMFDAIGARMSQSSATRIRAAIMVIVFAMLSLISVNQMHAQSIGTGSIQGNVYDSSGAVVPNATVTAVDPQTGYKVIQTSSGSGSFAFLLLPPATYRVTVNATGFQSLVQNSVTLNALATLTLNLNLKPGASSEVVNVTSEQPQIDTVNGTLEETLGNNAYSNLPIAMSGGPKNPTSLTTLLPGTESGGNGIYRINGGVGEASFIYVNGMPLMTSELQGDNRNIAASTSTEVVDQFQVISSGVPAYYEGEGVTNYVSKSGTNKFHGDVYENIRNTIFDAAGYFNAKVPVEHNNEYGVTVGGPILKNRLFFFFNYDKYKFSSVNTPGTYSIPTIAEQGGDFSAFPVAIYDPATMTCTAGVCTRTQFPGNIIPASRISSISKNLQSKLPTPINSGIQSNFLNALPSNSTSTLWDGKFDYTVSEKNHAYFLVQYGGTTQPQLNSNGGANLPVPYVSSRFGATKIRIFQLGDTQIVTSHLLNIFGYQMNRFLTPFTNPTTGGNYATGAGLTGLPSAGEAGTNFPPIGFGGPNSPNSWAQSAQSQSFSQIANTTTLQDNVLWTLGKHSLTIGGQIVWQAENDSKPSLLNSLNFANTETAGFSGTGALLTTTGNAYASYLLGLVDSGSLTDTSVQEFGGRYRDYALYVQDDWKLNNKLTVNIGLRYSIPTPLVEVKNRSSFLNASLPDAAAGNIPGVLQFAGNGPASCNCRTLVQTHYLTFGPRFGFAYSLNNKTVVRGSYGIMHYNAGALGGNATSTGSGSVGAVGIPDGFAQNITVTSPDSGITPSFNWNSGFPSYALPPVFSATLDSGYNTTTGAKGGTPTYTRPTTGGKSPYSEFWNLTLQRQLDSATSVQVSYAGSASHFIPVNGGYGIYSDQLDPKYLVLGSLLQQAYSPTTLAQAQAIMPGITLPYANFVGSIAQMLRPFPQYAGLYDNAANFGNGIYHSLQIFTQRRMYKGLDFLGSFTWAKEIDDVGGGNVVNPDSSANRSAYNLHMDRSIGASDVPISISIAYVYKLPFGKGEHWSTNNKALDYAFGGWQISGLQQYNATTPFGKVGATCNVPNTAGCTADYTPGYSGTLKPLGNWGTGGPKGGKVYLDRAAFQTPASFTFGTTPITYAYHLRGNYSQNESLSLSKRFDLVKSTSLKLQVDAFNLPNRVIFGNPNTNTTSSAFGTVTGQSNAARKLQFEAYLYF